MPQNESACPLKFLGWSDFINLEDLLERPDILRMEIAKDIIRGSFHDWWGNRVDLPATANADAVTQLKTALAWRIAGELLDAVSAKLKRQYPHGAPKHRRLLFLEQAMAYLKDAWVEAFIEFPKHPPATRCQKILPLLKQWPGEDMRARPEHGLASQLWYLGIYEDVNDRLTGLPRGPVRIDTRDERKDFLKSLFHDVPPVGDRKKRYIFHPETREIFFEASEQDIDRWSKLPRHKIALEITVKVLERSGVHITPNYLHRILPELRDLAYRIEHAKQSLQKSK